LKHLVDKIFVLAIRGVIFGGLIINFFEVGDGGASGVVVDGFEWFGGEGKLIVVDGEFLS